MSLYRHQRVVNAGVLTDGSAKEGVYRQLCHLAGFDSQTHAGCGNPLFPTGKGTRRTANLTCQCDTRQAV